MHYTPRMMAMYSRYEWDTLHPVQQIRPSKTRGGYARLPGQAKPRYSQANLNSPATGSNLSNITKTRKFVSRVRELTEHGCHDSVRCIENSKRNLHREIYRRYKSPWRFSPSTARSAIVRGPFKSSERKNSSISLAPD